MSYPYNTIGFLVPAPALNISVRNKHLNKEEHNVLFLIDSGSDYSSMPKGMATKLSLQPHDFVTSMDFDNQPHDEKPLYYADLKFQNFNFDDIQVDEINHNFGLIGRDILNQLKLVLDGQSLTFTIQ